MRRTGAAFVASISDPDLRAEVSSLLAADSDGPDISAVVGEAAEAVLDASSSGQTIAHFRLLRLLGRGGMGEVFLAQDLKLGRQVALKLLPRGFEADPERLRLFEREARAAAALNHPNIMAVYEVGHSDGRRFIATEYVEGETVARPFAAGRFRWRKRHTSRRR